MLGCHRQANQPAAILRHEIDDLRRNLFGCDSQIALVFASLIINDDCHLPRAYCCNGVIDSCERARAPIGFSNNLKSLSHKECPPPRLICPVPLKLKLELTPERAFRESGSPESWLANN